MNYKYYTLQIHWGGTNHPTVTELKNLTPETKEFNGWLASVRKTLFTCGFTIQLGPQSWELIHPYLINKVLLIEQPNRYE